VKVIRTSEVLVAPTSSFYPGQLSFFRPANGIKLCLPGLSTDIEVTKKFIAGST
jgi:hypothetical protein